MSWPGPAFQRRGTSITTAPGALFSVKDRYRNCLRMNCGLPWTDTIETALRTLGALAKAQR